MGIGIGIAMGIQHHGLARCEWPKIGVLPGVPMSRRQNASPTPEPSRHLELPSPMLLLPLEITLRLLDPFVLVQPDKQYPAELFGRLEVTVTNPGPDAVSLAPMGPNGAVFRAPATGEEHAVFHPCDAMATACFSVPFTDGPVFTAHPLPAGASWTFVVEDWACSSSWVTLTPGAWELVYRVRTLDPTRSAPATPPTAHSSTCRLDAGAPTFWLGSSQPLPITLGRPRRSAPR